MLFSFIEPRKALRVEHTQLLPVNVAAFPAVKAAIPSLITLALEVLLARLTEESDRI